MSSNEFFNPYLYLNNIRSYTNYLLSPYYKNSYSWEDYGGTDILAYAPDHPDSVSEDEETLSGTEHDDNGYVEQHHSNGTFELFNTKWILIPQGDIPTPDDIQNPDADENNDTNKKPVCLSLPSLLPLFTLYVDWCSSL